MERTCKHCDYWKRLRRNLGECRIQPPAPTSFGTAMWPQTRSGDWCGKHSAHAAIALRNLERTIHQEVGRQSESDQAAR